MSETQQQTNPVEARQKQYGLWTAGVFTLLGLAFFFYDIYMVFIRQQGRFDLADKLLMPVTIVMFLTGIVGRWLILRDRLSLGTNLLFYFIVVIPPVLAVLLLLDMASIAILYIVSLGSIMILWVLPKASRRWAILSAVIAIVLCLAVEYWNPGFRDATSLGAFANIATVLAVLLILALIIRQVFASNIMTKIITAVVIITLQGVVIVGGISQRSYRLGLTEDVGDKLAKLADAHGIGIANAVDREMNILITLSLSKTLQNAARMSNQTNKISESEIETLDGQWQAADLANNNSDPLVFRALYNPTSDELRSFRSRVTQHIEVFLTDTQGVVVSATNRTSDYYQADEEWWQRAYLDGQYIGQPEYDESSKTTAIIMAVAILENGNGRILGVLRTTVNLSSITDALTTGIIGQTGQTIVLLPSGNELKLSAKEDGTYELVEEQASPELLALSQSTSEYQSLTLNGVPVLASMADVKGTGENIELISNLNWQVATIQDSAEALQAVDVQARSAILLGVFITLLGIIAAIILSRVIANPIVRLNAVARKIAGGDITARAQVETKDEIGTLATNLNLLTQQLSDFINTLEKRVTDRTKNLELATEVGRTVSQVRTLDMMLRDAAEIIRESFDLYYVQVYLANPAKNELLLQSGTGTIGAELVGRGHRLPLDTGSINGRAAVEKQSVVIENTETSPTFRPNPLLPETRSEIAIPLMVGERVVGVLDLQSRKIGALNTDLLSAFEAMAGQLAIAIQNASLLADAEQARAEAEQARAEAEKQARRLVRRNWDDYLDAIHTPEQLGFAFEGNNVVPLTEIEPLPSTDDNSVLAPITITGEPLGSLVVELSRENQTPQNMELIQSMARQVAQQIESLRLLESTERYRLEAEDASRRITREGWKNYMERSGERLGYLYDLKQVRPSSEIQQEDMFTLPLKIRDVTVGKLAIQGLSSDNPESLELVNAVAERLGAHIESLRQYGQTQSALAQSEKLFEASRVLTQATDLQELTATSVNQIGIPEINRAVLTIFNYDAENNINGLDIVANWWNGTGHEVTAVGTHYPLEVIRVMPMFVSATPVFFGDTSKDERVDETTMQLVQRLNLRAVAVLPLFIGSHQIGALIMEAEEPHFFTNEEIRLFSALAPQIATVLENRRQFERAQKQAERESTLNLISQKIQSATSVEAVLQIAARELGRALGAPLTIAQLGMKEHGNDSK